ncbi:hypothetical protein EsH8_XI_000024 [Colletotrichum jinshuiense]
MGSLQNTEVLKVALVRRPPPNWPLPLNNRDWTGIKIDISQTIDEAIDLMKEAKKNGANLIAFPELWFPGFPKWREQNDWKKTHLNMYIDNALVVGSHEWNRLISAVKVVGIWAALAFAERKDNRLFMAQALVSPKGELVMHRHKLRPSGSERDMFSDGEIDMLKVINTDLGRVSMLQCGEHFYPSMTFPVAAQRPKLHIGAFPFASDFDDTSDSVFYNASLVTHGSSGFALLSGAHVLMPSIGYTFIFDPLMRIVARMDNSISYDDHPILYHSMNAAQFHSGETYDPDSQVSWGVLQQINKGYPAYIPKAPGVLTKKRTVSVSNLREGLFEWSETGPGTTADGFKPNGERVESEKKTVAV